MPKPVTIALDVMGGDNGPGASVPAAKALVQQHPELRILLVGQPEAIYRNLQGDHPRLTVVEAAEVVGMDEKPADALRKKKNSSLRVAIDHVKAGSADACVSAGNTGALMATGKFVLKTLQGIDRPAIMAAIPTVRGHVHMLDLGANSDCSAEHLFQFAVMGSVVSAVIENIPAPRVALLNIGEEDIKGNDVIRETAAMLAASNLNYVGFIEGDAIMKHKADVVVCDGFTGNVALKVMEGTASLVAQLLRNGFGSSLYGRMAGLVAWPVLNRLKASVDPRHYNGASLVGLTGIVVKSHGGADQLAFRQALRVAMLEVEKGVPEKINRLLTEQNH